MSAEVDALVRELHGGAADFIASTERLRSALVALEAKAPWRERFATFEEFVESVIGMPADAVERFLSAPHPIPIDTH